MANIISTDHMILIHVSHPKRVRDLISELRQDPAYAQKDIVIVDPNYDENPIDLPRVYFVAGNPIEHDVLKQAGIDRASSAIVLSTKDSQSSDAMAAAVIGVIESLNPEIYSVVECLSERHRHLFHLNDCDAIICTGRLNNNLLIQEMQDHGIAAMIEMITSNSSGSTLYTIDVTETGTAYQELAKSMLDKDANLLAIRRGKDTHTSFRALAAEKNDQLIYVGAERYDWQGLKALCG